MYQVATIQNMKNYELVFLDSVMRLILCFEKLKKSCSTLLRDLPDEAIRKLVVYGVGWDTMEVKRTLNQRLGPEKMAIYLGVMSGLGRRLELVRHKLKLEKDFTASRRSLWGTEARE